MSTSEIVSVLQSALDDLLLEAQREPHLECCGLLAGRNGVISAVLPARNHLASATAYEIDPVDLFALFRRMRAAGLDLLGIYHSHPRGDNAPSRSDIDQAYYPQAAYFILSPLPGAPMPIRAFRIANGAASELIIQPV